MNLKITSFSHLFFLSLSLSLSSLDSHFEKDEWSVIRVIDLKGNQEGRKEMYEPLPRRERESRAEKKKKKKKGKKGKKGSVMKFIPRKRKMR